MQKTIRSEGAQIADPLQMNRKVVERGVFWKRGARSGGGYKPAANHSTGNLDSMTAVFYDRQNKQVAEPARGGIINARVDNLALSTNAAPTFVGATTTGTSTTPRVTYSGTATSKSYSPASMPKLGK